MNKVSLTRLAQVHPLLQQKITQLCGQFDTKFPGWSLEITQGLRSFQEQHALFAQGRDSLADVNTYRHDVGWAPLTESGNLHIVTAADSAYSWHCFGCAVDVAPESLSGIDWDGNDEHWEFIVESGEALGMVSGISWHDEPHFQLEDIPTTPDDSTRALFVKGGVDAVWAGINESPTALDA